MSVSQTQIESFVEKSILMPIFYRLWHRQQNRNYFFSTSPSLRKTVAFNWTGKMKKMLRGKNEGSNFLPLNYTCWYNKWLILFLVLQQFWKSNIWPIKVSLWKAQLVNYYWVEVILFIYLLCWMINDLFELSTFSVLIELSLKSPNAKKLIDRFCGGGGIAFYHWLDCPSWTTISFCPST